MCCFTNMSLLKVRWQHRSAVWDFYMYLLVNHIYLMSQSAIFIYYVDDISTDLIWILSMKTIKDGIFIEIE